MSRRDKYPTKTLLAIGTRPREPDNLLLNLNVLQPRIKLRHAGFVWPKQNCPQTEAGLSQGCLLNFEFWVLAAVAFGLLIWGSMADYTDTIGRELNWMMSTLNHQLTDFNWKNDMLISSCIIDELFSCFDSYSCFDAISTVALCK